MDERNRNPSPAVSPRVEGGDADVRREPSPAEIRLLEERISAQSHEIRMLHQENQRLAVTHVGLQQELAATKQEIQRLSVSASAIKAERDAQVRDIRERLVRLEVDARPIERLKEELVRVRSEVCKMQAERQELVEKKRLIDAEFIATRPKLQQFSELKTEMEFLKEENQRGRNAIENEKALHSNHLKQSDVMEKHLIALSREEDELRTRLQRAMAASSAAMPTPAASMPAPYSWPGYAADPLNVVPGYHGDHFFFPYAAPQVNYAPMPYYGVGPAAPAPPPLQNNTGCQHSNPTT